MKWLLKQGTYHSEDSENLYNDLHLKQYIQVKIKESKRKNPKFWIVLVATILLLAAFIFSGYIAPTAYNVSKSKYKHHGIQFTFLGDVMLGGNIQSLSKKNKYSSLYKNTKNVWANSDLVFANFESTVITSSKHNYKPIKNTIDPIATNQKSVRTMKKYGINAVAFANDHCADYRKYSFESTTKCFEKFGIYYAGKIDKEAFNSSKLLPSENEEKYKPYTSIKVKGKKIGFISVTDVYYEKMLSYGILTTADSDLNFYINESAKDNDYTIVYVHWGEQNVKNVSQKQKEQAHSFINAGADLVIGTHPHILQNVEIYNNGLICYSLGNFISDDIYSDNRDSAIVQYNETKSGKKTVEIIPIRIISGIPQISSKGYYTKRIQNSLIENLDKNKYSLKSNGNIIIKY